MDSARPSVSHPATQRPHLMYRARRMFSVVVHTPDVVGERMAGPGIRAWHLAHAISSVAPVTLVARMEGQLPSPPAFAIAERGSVEAEDAQRDAAVLVGQPARGFRRRRREQKLIADLFDPTVLELRELYGTHPSLRQRIHVAAEWWRLAESLMRADVLMSAALKQREFYRALQSSDAPWIDVPFGIDPAELSACPKPQDELLIWGGGVWEWLDPATAIDAVLQLNREGVRCRMLFLGRTRPNRDLIDRRRDDRFSRLLERGAGLVSANDEWVPYRERLSWLRSGRITIMLHRATPEAEYSIRTRLFDSIAAGVPVIATEKGFAAELVAREGLGVVVPPGDTTSVVAAIRLLLRDDAFHASCVSNLQRLRTEFAWERVTRPLTLTIERWKQDVH
jgi:glycosyltransferase involved in cell wall biosynthesis